MKLKYEIIISSDMSEPTISPDGKYMWTGSEWIPLPPNSDSEQQTPNLQAVNLQDSVIGGDVVHNTVINNDATAVTSAVVQALQQLGMIGQPATTPQAPPVPEVELSLIHI